MIQTWQIRFTQRATEVGGLVKLVITETLDFNKRVLTSHSRGMQEGFPVNETVTSDILAHVTPDASARYRATHGYTRIA